MPRGIPGSGKAKAKAQTKPKKAGASAPVVPSASTKPPSVKNPPASVERESHHSDVDRMFGEGLKAYARKVGVTPRDVEGLTEDKLRQSVKLMLAARFEDD